MLVIVNSEGTVFAELSTSPPPEFTDKSLETSWQTFGIFHDGRIYRLPTENDPSFQSKYTLFLETLKHFINSFPDRELEAHGFKVIEIASKV
jgi:hypothetical protein